MHPKKFRGGMWKNAALNSMRCVCVWHPSIKIKSKLTEHIKKTTRKLNFTRNGISYSCWVTSTDFLRSAFPLVDTHVETNKDSSIKLEQGLF